MPNYKLGKPNSAIREHIKRRAAAIASRRTSYARANFPLTTAQIQSLLVSEDAYASMVRLEAAGVQDLPKSACVSLRIKRDDALFPGLKRGIAVNLELPQKVFIMRSTYRFRDYDSGDECFAQCNWQALDHSDRVALVDWVNNFVKARRLEEVVNGTVEKVLDRFETTAHVVAGWPMLATLVEDREWISRFRNVPKNLTPFAPPSQLITSFADVMKATEVVLAGGMLLDNYEHTPGTILLVGWGYETFPNDRKF
jgi:hypothetical protein